MYPGLPTRVAGAEADPICVADGPDELISLAVAIPPYLGAAISATEQLGASGLTSKSEAQLSAL